MMFLLFLLQDEGPRTADVPNAMGAHTWFIIAFVGAFLLWSISYSLQLHKDALARRKGREDFTKRKDELIDRIVDLESKKEAGSMDDKKYRQELRDLKLQLARILEKTKSH